MVRDNYIEWLRAILRGLDLEYKYYYDQQDAESCYEVKLEWQEWHCELMTFLRAEKRSNAYHGGH